jgi:hypothetical protein
MKKSGFPFLFFWFSLSFLFISQKGIRPFTPCRSRPFSVPGDGACTRTCTPDGNTHLSEAVLRHGPS